MLICTLCDIIQLELKITGVWCKRDGLHINPVKATVVSFITANKEIKQETGVKHFGITLEQQLEKTHDGNICLKSSWALIICRSTAGNKCGYCNNGVHAYQWTWTMRTCSAASLGSTLIRLYIEMEARRATFWILQGYLGIKELTKSYKPHSELLIPRYNRVMKFHFDKKFGIQWNNWRH